MAVKVAITITDGPDTGASMEFEEGALLVGRRKGQFILNDKKVSSEHCRFVIDGNTVYIEDAGSTNGTFLKGSRIEARQRLENLDEVIVGLSRLSVAIVEQVNKNRPQPPRPAASPNFDDSSSISFIEENSDHSGNELDDLLSHVDFKKGSAASSAQAGKAPAKKETLAPGRFSDAIDREFDTHQAEPEASGLNEATRTATHKLPADDAEYRHTGIQRIEDLIRDEMETFSKWDDPAVADANDSSAKVLGIPRLRVKLKVKRGPDGQKEFECIRPVTTIGRKEADIRLNDLDCSRKHAQIELVIGKTARLKDLASTNGTYLNGKKISESEVKTGDMIQVGQTLFEVTLETV